MKETLIIAGARVLDPGAGADEVRDLFVRDGRLASSPGAGPATTIDAAGLCVSPGFIDSHAHMFAGGTEIGAEADSACLPSCATRVVDAGSAGCSTVDSFLRGPFGASIASVTALLNVSSQGQTTMSIDENLDPERFDEESILRVFARYPEIVKGLKVRQHAAGVGGRGADPLRRTQEIAKAVRDSGFDCNVTVHFADAACEVAELMGLMRGGDVIAHTYCRGGRSILDGEGRVRASVREARSRGVLFDSCGGRFHLSYEVAAKALADGFPPDLIGTDLVSFSMYRRPVFSLAHVMSIFLSLGMELPDVVRAVTATAGAAYRIAEQPRLSEGAPADLALFERREGGIPDFVDPYGYRIPAARWIKPMATIKGGRIVFRQMDL